MKTDKNLLFLSKSNKRILVNKRQLSIWLNVESNCPGAIGYSGFTFSTSGKYLFEICCFVNLDAQYQSTKFVVVL